MSVLEQVKADTAAAMKAGERERVAALRLVTNELQRAHKEASGSEADELAVLQRERKRRLEAAEAYREALALTNTDAERRYLDRRLAEIADARQ